jgi:hypothetical protein
MHAFQRTARPAMGARSRPRRDAGAVGPSAPEYAHPTSNRKTSVRDHQGVDGRYPLPDAKARKGENGDEPLGSRLQPGADDRDPRGAADDPGHQGSLKTHWAPRRNRQGSRFRSSSPHFRLGLELPFSHGLGGGFLPSKSGRQGQESAQLRRPYPQPAMSASRRQPIFDWS